MDDKNFLLAIVLCVGVYALWFGFVEPRFVSHPPVPAANKAPQTALKEAGLRASAAPSGPPSGGLPAPVELKTADAEIQISPLGAAISSYRYRGPLGLVELVAQASPGLLAAWPDMVFTPVQVQGNPPLAAFEAKSPDGLLLRKEFRFAISGALESLRLTIRNPGPRTARTPPWELRLGPGLGTVASEEKDNPKLWRAIGLFPPPPNRAQDSIEQLKAGEREGPWRWLAVDNRYFLSAVLASPEDFDRCRVETVKIGEHAAPGLSLRAKPVSLPPGGFKTFDVPFYIGPKNYAGLRRTGVGLERSVNFGWFDTLGRWTLQLLQYLHRLTGNYGWSIILLTIMIQGALFPLTFKSLQSMAGMRKVQPDIARLQQKFKEDPQRLNTEMMELYKSRGVNPMGGCLPMLVQMPVFVALFNALRNAWELHGAPWILWIHDLSAHDPFYVLPLIMGGVMFLQNKMNPTVAADPAQAAMMNWMPVIFTFMFIKFPAGLVLYWLTNSILSALQQLALRRQLA